MQRVHLGPTTRMTDTLRLDASPDKYKTVFKPAEILFGGLYSRCSSRVVRLNRQTGCNQEHSYKILLILCPC